MSGTILKVQFSKNIKKGTSSQEPVWELFFILKNTSGNFFDRKQIFEK